jgi:hypothetical protein
LYIPCQHTLQNEHIHDMLHSHHHLLPAHRVVSCSHVGKMSNCALAGAAHLCIQLSSLADDVLVATLEPTTATQALCRQGPI